jgi:hypothetical protein
VILLGNRDNNRTRTGKHRPKQRSGDIRLLGARTGIESAQRQTSLSRSIFQAKKNKNCNPLFSYHIASNIHNRNNRFQTTFP